MLIISAQKMPALYRVQKPRSSIERKYFGQLYLGIDTCVSLTGDFTWCIRHNVENLSVDPYESPIVRDSHFAVSLSWCA